MITLIIPCFNEQSNINIIIKNIKIFKNKHLVVDGGSKDNSIKLYEKNNINFITTLLPEDFNKKKEQKRVKLIGFSFFTQILC